MIDSRHIPCLRVIASVRIIRLVASGIFTPMAFLTLFNPQEFTSRGCRRIRPHPLRHRNDANRIRAHAEILSWKAQEYYRKMERVTGVEPVCLTAAVWRTAEQPITQDPLKLVLLAEVESA